jgi:formylglycine-generating enzyme required for sulfatase activity/predicted Ser/Thr protein kinase
MSGFVQALQAYRDGTLTREKLLTEVERQLTQREMDAVSLLKLLNEEHSRIRLPDNLHSALAARILQFRDPPSPFKLQTSRAESTDTVFLERDPGAAGDGPSAAPDVEPRRTAPITLGSVLQGRFKLVENIGQGGMSVVYKAIDLRKIEARATDPYVAVKLLTVPSSGFGHSLTLLQSEAQKLQSLPHPNIVRVIDVDRDGRTVFMTMEYLTGESLKRLLLAPDFKGLPAAEAERVLEAIAAALEFAHQNDIIHGDLKPGNIIITQKGEVKVIDFGIARLMTRPQPGMASTAVTPGGAPAEERPWEVAGLTPLYASPEMLELRGPDPRDDVYALACIAHELLTGQHPFDQKSALEARDSGTRLVRRKELSRGQFHAIEHGLEFERDKRTASAAAFLEEFRDRQSAGKRWTALLAILVAVALVASLYFALHGRVGSAVSSNSSHVAPVATLASGEVFRDCPTCPLMKVLPPGTFMQGSPATDPDAQAFEQPQHSVRIGYAFGVGVYEVTVGEFRDFVDATKRKIAGCTVYDGAWHERPDLSWNDVGYPQSSTQPVACVSWRDSRDYTTWLSHKTGQHYRLASASEWEYAARAGSEARHPWASDAEACKSANIADLTAAERYPGWKVHQCTDGYVYSAPVGSFAPNAFGVYDMLGNVFEWVEDCWHADYGGAPGDGSAWVSGDCSQHDMRGGSWFTAAPNVSVAARNRFEEGYRSNSVGFRIVREIE